MDDLTAQLPFPLRGIDSDYGGEFINHPWASWCAGQTPPVAFTLITTNQAYKNWLCIFNNDSTLTSVVLDRMLHHAETVTLEGKSYRMKKVVEEA